jgi:hypothetical protein
MPHLPLRNRVSRPAGCCTEAFDLGLGAGMGMELLADFVQPG